MLSSPTRRLRPLTQPPRRETRAMHVAPCAAVVVYFRRVPASTGDRRGSSLYLLWHSGPSLAEPLVESVPLPGPLGVWSPGWLTRADKGRESRWLFSRARISKRLYSVSSLLRIPRLILLDHGTDKGN